VWNDLEAGGRQFNGRLQERPIERALSQAARYSDNAKSRARFV
jgi:hypothetical protein